MLLSFLSVIAKEKNELKRIGVTHVLNAAQGTKFNQINTDESFYSYIGVNFLGVKAIDIARFQMSQHFSVAADFIENALSSEGMVYFVIPYHQFDENIYIL